VPSTLRGQHVDDKRSKRIPVTRHQVNAEMNFKGFSIFGAPDLAEFKKCLHLFLIIAVGRFGDLRGVESRLMVIYYIWT
jgi:hypothetical protein